MSTQRTECDFGHLQSWAAAFISRNSAACKARGCLTGKLNLVRQKMGIAWASGSGNLITWVGLWELRSFCGPGLCEWSPSPSSGRGIIGLPAWPQEAQGWVWVLSALLTYLGLITIFEPWILKDILEKTSVFFIPLFSSRMEWNVGFLSHKSIILKSVKKYKGTWYVETSTLILQLGVMWFAQSLNLFVPQHFCLFRCIFELVPGNRCLLYALDREAWVGMPGMFPSGDPKEDPLKTLLSGIVLCAG